MSKKKHFIYLGNLGFPYGLAEIQRTILISKCLILGGNHVTVVCKKGILNEKDHPDLKPTGYVQDIEYVYTSGTPFYPQGLIKRNLIKLKGIINEFSLLRKRRKEGRLDFAILSTHDFDAVLYYFILSKLFGFKIILNYVEFYSGLKKKKSQLKSWLNDKLFDKYGPSLSDGVFPISEFIINHIKEVSPGKPHIKVSVLTDFDRYNDIELLQEEKYFLFCGDAGYKETIIFIIDSFASLRKETGKDFYLYLVINGNPVNVADVKNYISNNPEKDRIKVFSKLPQKQLFTYYKNAIALLIPLRPTFQDIARFPHKTGEYLASGNPVISTNYGEVKHYFKDGENMLLADEYDISKFSAKMQFVIDNPDAAKEIGLEGKKIASLIFDYKTQATAIDDFFNELLIKK